MEHEDELLIKKRFIDLSRLASRRCTVAFSNFLNLNELNLFGQVKDDLETDCRLWGGYEFAERQMIAFIPDALSYEFPISCLRFSPAHLKFAEELTHRDILGALMHLGVERSRIGDIKIDGSEYFIFCEEGIADYLLGSLSRIRHTSVKGEIAASGSFQFEQKFEHLSGIVSSNRIDSIISLAAKTSRSQSVQMIRAQKVFVNEAVVSSNAHMCKEGDVISIRGFGKYIYEGSSGETKKGRMKVSLKKYS